MSIADSTKHQYDSIIQQFRSFCGLQENENPPEEVTVVANFLAQVALQSDRPKSKVNVCVAAIQCLYSAFDMDNICDNYPVRRLVCGIIKGGTQCPRIKTPAMPIEPFQKLFCSWADNETLSIQCLRLKCITLLALVAMLRPSDIAPRGSVIDQDMVIKKIIFSVNDVAFLDDGTMNITIHGNKNDYDRDGFHINIPPASVAKMDPVAALKCYIERTEKFRSDSVSSVFLSLTRRQGVFQGLQSSGIRTILNEAIKMAGLNRSEFTSKCFRVTGATTAVRAGQDPNIVRSMGRWKSCSVFEEHYVHNIPPEDYTDKILSHK